MRCNQSGSVDVKVKDLVDYLDGSKHVQNAFPYLDAGLREQIITGTHPKCWDEMFPPELNDESEPTAIERERERIFKVEMYLRDDLRSEDSNE